MTLKSGAVNEIIVGATDNIRPTVIVLFNYPTSYWAPTIRELREIIRLIEQIENNEHLFEDEETEDNPGMDGVSLYQ